MVAARLKAFAHRNLWQRLPRDLRRTALARVAASLAPRPDPATPASLPIIVAGTLRTASGLGESARLCHDALLAAGLPVYGRDLTPELMQRLDYPDARFGDGAALAGPGTVILHVNAPVVPLALLRLGRRFLRGKRLVGYWAWELPSVPTEWGCASGLLHEIWVPSRFTADAVRPVARGLPVRVVPHPAAPFRPAPRTRTDPRFTVLTVFNVASSFARKNPSAVVAAFRQAFGDDPGARLVVKAANGHAYPEGMAELRAAATGNVVLIEDVLPADDMAALFADADVLVSLHRSEGFGLTLAEAMLRGVPVVATDWSGNTDFLTAETGIPIPARLIPARDPQGIYEQPALGWADPDVTAAAAALRRLRDDPEAARALGKAGRRFAETEWDRTTYAARVRTALFGGEGPASAGAESA